MTGMEQAALICFMFFTVLPLLALPSAWQERGWQRVRAVATCFAMWLLMTGLTSGYVLLIGGAS